MEVFLSLNLLMMLCNVDYEICKHFARTSNQLDPLLKPIFSFCPLNEAEVSILLLSSHPTTCLLDLIPSHLLQAISPSLLPALTHIINTYLLTGIFSTAFKQARITPLLKKPTLNTSLIENYRPVSLLPFIAKTLEQVVFNQVSLFLSQNNKLDAKQSGFRSGHSTALLSVTEALRIAKADSKSSVFILLDLSAAFDTVNHQILLSTLSSLDITGIPLRWFESYLTGRSFRVAWGGEVSKAHQLVTGVPQGLVLGPPPFIHIHYITGSHHTSTWLLLPFLRWWHTALSLISTRWSKGSCTDLRLLGQTFSAWMKEHHLQLNQAKTELIVFPATPNLQHDFTIKLGSSIMTPISFGQKSWCTLRWPADLQRARCKDCSILQVCTTQHQKDQALSDRACCTTSCPGPCHFQAGLLQCSSGWTSIKYNQTSTNDSECSGTTGLQRAQKSPCYTSLCLLALATSCSSHPVQDTDACI